MLYLSESKSSVDVAAIYLRIYINCVFPQVPVITNLEQKALELLSKRADGLMERRRQDVRDQAEEVAMQASKSSF